MDHVVIPLRRDHVGALATLAEGVASAAGVARSTVRPNPHVTLVAYTGLARAAALVAVEAAVADSGPFVLYAHGYGFFTGDDPQELSLHVPVVRNGPLDALHRDVCDGLHRAGAIVAGWSESALWSPHITLLDRGLDAAGLGAAAAWLAHRHHPSWHVPVDRVLLTGGWTEREEGGDLVALVGP